MDFFGKNVFISGSSRGIGFAIANKFASLGANVVLNSRKSEEELDKAYKSLLDKGFSCYKVLSDVSDYESCVKTFDEIKNVFGEVDILINNAGISKIGLFQDLSPFEWKEVMDINIGSVFNCTHIVSKSMIKNKKGSIINISSIWGDRGASCEAVYSASKGAMNSFTKAMAKELAPSGIRVNAVSCGVIDTSMNSCFTQEEKESIIDGIGLMRYGTPDEIAEICVFLASEKSSYISGQVITVDGCMY